MFWPVLLLMVLTVICVFPVGPGAEWAQLTAPTQARTQLVLHTPCALSRCCLLQQLQWEGISSAAYFPRGKTSLGIGVLQWDPALCFPTSLFFRCLRRWGVLLEDPWWDNSSLHCPWFLPFSVTFKWTTFVCRTCSNSLYCTTAFFALWTPTLIFELLRYYKNTRGIYTIQSLWQPG